MNMFDLNKTTTELENNGVWTSFGEGEFLISLKDLTAGIKYDEFLKRLTEKRGKKK